MERLQVDVAEVAVELPAEGVAGEITGGVDFQACAGIVGGGGQRGVAVGQVEACGDVAIGDAVVAEMLQVDIADKARGGAEWVEAFAVDVGRGGDVGDAQGGEDGLEGEFVGVKSEAVALDAVLPVGAEGDGAVGGGGVEVGADVASVEGNVAVEGDGGQVNLLGHPGVEK